MYTWHFLGKVVVKAAGLFLLINLAFAAWNDFSILGKISGYNWIFPGRSRLPFGENQQKAYNLSINNLDAMFASHEIAKKEGKEEEYQVFLLGDSSVWGTLLTPQQTLSSQLNEMDIRCSDGRKIKFYNLGYPTLSLAKDVMILNEAMQYSPDRVIWLVTLESFVRQNQIESPFVTNNLLQLEAISRQFNLDFELGLEPAKEQLLSRSIVGKRRDLADLARLQLYGVLWAATGIDQEYPEAYTPAKRDLEADMTYHGWGPRDIPADGLALGYLEAGMKIAGNTPVILVNEPILISKGKNSNIRYNFYYPRWVYDEYRQILKDLAQQHSWYVYDAWDSIAEEEFSNSAIHLTPKGVAQFAKRLKGIVADPFCE